MKRRCQELQGSFVKPTVKDRIERRTPLLMSVIVFIIIVGVNRFLQPNFFNKFVIRSNVATFLPLIVASVAQTMVILTGNIDLSLGAIITLVNVVVVRLFGLIPDASGWLLTLPIFGGILVGLLAGMINGLLIARLRLQAVIATFATNLVWMGLTLYIMPVPGGSVPFELTSFYRRWFLGIPMSLWFLVLVVVLWIIMRRTKLIRYFYAVGGSAPNAFTSGINVERVLVSAYALCGFFAGLSGLALTLDISSGDPLVGHPLTLSAVTAVVIGGTLLSGGVGTPIGSIFGASILGLVRNIIFFANVSPFYQDFIFGVIVIFALIFSSLGARRRTT